MANSRLYHVLSVLLGIFFGLHLSASLSFYENVLPMKRLFVAQGQVGFPHKGGGIPFFLSSLSSSYPFTGNYPSVASHKTRIYRTRVNGSRDSSENLSASARERREEERRRKERINEVVIGQTSALSGAKDLELNPGETEKQLIITSGEIEREVHLQTEKGLDSLRLLQLEEAKIAFDRVFDLKPSAYLWQAGLVLFYLNDVHAAGVCFCKNARIYENRFGEPASEERIWRDACQLKLLSSLPKRDRKNIVSSSSLSANLPIELVPSIPPQDESQYGFKKETRKVLRIARELFDASVCGDHSRMILSRAKLQVIAAGPGGSTPGVGRKIRPDRKQWKLNSWFYLGLHYDALGDISESKQCMKKAVLFSSGMNTKDIVHCLPLMHMARRDWFDDDEMELDDGIEDFSERSRMVESIRSSVEKMAMADIRNALKKKNLRSSGSKADLQHRFFDALVEETEELL